jgi:hypothetical protein
MRDFLCNACCVASPIINNTTKSKHVLNLDPFQVRPVEPEMDFIFRTDVSAYVSSQGCGRLQTGEAVELKP